jgi:hypothetical protein
LTVTPVETSPLKQRKISRGHFLSLHPEGVPFITEFADIAEIAWALKVFHTKYFNNKIFTVM